MKYWPLLFLVLFPMFLHTRPVWARGFIISIQYTVVRETLRALCGSTLKNTEHNACDFLAEGPTWAWSDAWVRINHSSKQATFRKMGKMSEPMVKNVNHQIFARGTVSIWHPSSPVWSKDWWHITGSPIDIFVSWRAWARQWGNTVCYTQNIHSE